MISSITRSMASRQLVSRPVSVYRGANAFQIRTYADNTPSQGSTTRGEPGATTNIRSTPSANPEGAEVNAKRGAERGAPGDDGVQDTGSVQTPVSHPEKMGMGQQEEPQPSQDNMRSDPSEPDHVKRERVEAEGQKPLDPANQKGSPSPSGTIEANMETNRK